MVRGPVGTCTSEMPEYVLAFILSAFLGGLGWLGRRIEQVDGKIDALEVKVAEEYVTKASLTSAMDRLESYFTRIEDKLDRHIENEPTIDQLEAFLLKHIIHKNHD